MKEVLDGSVERETSAYKRMVAAQAEEDRLMREFYEFVESAPDRLEGERRALRELAPSIEAARMRSQLAFEEWERELQEKIKD